MARKKTKSPTSAKKTGKATARFTPKQGQYLAYLYLFRKLHRYSPSESEIAKFFRVSPPSVHQMIVKLEENGLITREPGAARSIRVTVPRSELPPLDDDEEDAALAARPVAPATTGAVRIYTLQVFLIGGPLPEKFAGKAISRLIQIRGDQTLEHLHGAIFQAYNRFDEHFYEFQFGKGPNDPKGKRYVLPEMFAEGVREPTVVGDVTRTTIDSLNLKIEQPFGYWFDYGDDWWHQINVEAIEEKIPKTAYPRVTKRVGKSPPQYPDQEESS